MSKVELNSDPELDLEQLDVAKLREIADYLENKVSQLPPSPGLSNGKGGAVLYFYMYAQWVNDDARYVSLCEKVLHSAIQDIYKGNTPGPLYYTELSEFGLLVNYLQQDGFLDHSFNGILDTIDSFCIKGAHLLCSQHNFDRFVGYLTLGQYFLTRPASETANVGLHLIIDTLLQSAIEDGHGGIFWESKLFNDNRIYLSWSHGSASIILFLIQVLEKEVHYRTDEIRACIASACRYIINNKVIRTDSLFPDIIGEEKSNSPLNLCYGDLGINYALLMAGKVLNNQSLFSAGKIGLLHSAARRSPDTCNIHDASVIYGASGLMVFFSSLFTQYNDDAFAMAASYWHSIAQQKSRHSNKTAGYTGYYNQGTPHVNETLYEGVTGFGLAMIAYQSGSTDLIKLIGY